MRILFLILAVLLTGPAPAAAPRPFDLDAANRLQQLQDPVISPDGRWVAYRLHRVDAEQDKLLVELWRVSPQGGEPQRLIPGGEPLNQLQWGGDGALYFLAARGDEAARKRGAQLWRLPREGGEAERLTDIAGGVDAYALSPDARRAVLVLTEQPPEPEKRPGWERKTPPPIVIDRFQFKRDGVGYLDGRPQHLHLLTLASGERRALTQGPIGASAPSWSPDGRWLAYLSAGVAPALDRSEARALMLLPMDMAEAVPRALLTLHTDGEALPQWSPDGRRLLLPAGDADDRWGAYQQWLPLVVDRDSGASRRLAAALDRGWQAAMHWSPDGRSIIGIVDDAAQSWLARVPVDDGAVQRLTPGGTATAPSVAADGRMALLLGGWDRPAEVHALAPGRAAQPQALTRHHADWRAGVQLSTLRRFSTRSADGTEVQGLLALPPGVPARALPTVLLIHGGPHAQDVEELGPGDALRERLAAAGYAVLQVNYRGSSGRGKAFARAIHGEWGQREVADLLAAVDWAVAEGVADPERLGLGGWSYGGILTNYLIASTPRFKAGVSGAGSANQIGLFGSDQYALQYTHELGAPWANWERWVRVSYPFVHADRIRTPTLYLGGELDHNVPIGGSEQMYQALRLLGVPTQLVVYPGQHHGLSLPSYRRDWESRFIAWMDRYLKP